MAEPLIVTEYDVKDANLLLRHLRKVGDRILKLDGRLESVERRPSGITVQDAKQALQANGTNPLRVDNLQGVLANPQPAKVDLYASAPTGQVLQALAANQLIVVGTTSTGDRLYRVVGGNPNTLRDINPAVSGSVVSVADTDFTVYDNADNTKKLQFEVSSVAAGTTRTMTIPDANQILAGRNVDNSFSVTQTFQLLVELAAAANVRPWVSLSESDVTAKGILQIVDGDLNLCINAYYDEASASWNRHNVAETSWRIELSTTNDWIRLHRATAAANPIAWSTSFTTTTTTIFSRIPHTFQDTVTGEALVTLNRSGQELLLKPSTAPAANTKIIELQSTASASRFSVDYEGDLLANSSTLANGLTVTAGGATVTAGGMTVTAGGVTVNAGGATITGNSTVTGTFAASDYMILNGGLRLANTLSVTTTPVTLTDDTFVIVNTSTGAKTVNLKASPTTGDATIIKDDSNNAGANNITVGGNGNNIDGAGSYLIAVNGMAAWFIYNGTQWNLLRMT